MPVPSAITDLSTTAASNYPAGTEAPNVIDDTLRAHASFIRQIYDGPLIPAGGSAGAPAYGFLSDSNTGWFSPSAGNIAAANDGAESMRINASGLTGFGADTMYGRVTIQRYAAEPYATLAVGDTATPTNTVGMYLRQTSGVSGFSTAGAALVFYTAGLTNGEALRLDSSQNVIARLTDTAPTLTVNSSMSFELTSNTSLKFVVRGSDGVTRSASLTLA